jgi:hypothetical protein
MRDTSPYYRGRFSFTMSSSSLTHKDNSKLRAELLLRGRARFVDLFGHEPPPSWGALWAAEFERAEREEKAFRPAVDALQRGKQVRTTLNGRGVTILEGDRAKKLRALLAERGIDFDSARWNWKRFGLLPDVVKDILLLHADEVAVGNPSGMVGYRRKDSKALRSEEFRFFDRSHWHQFLVAEFARVTTPPTARTLRVTIKGVAVRVDDRHSQSYLLRPRDIALLSYIVRVERRAVDIEGRDGRIKEDAVAIERIIRQHWGYSKSDMTECYAPKGVPLLAPDPPA